MPWITAWMSTDEEPEVRNVLDDEFRAGLVHWRDPQAWIGIVVVAALAAAGVLKIWAGW